MPDLRSASRRLRNAQDQAARRRLGPSLRWADTDLDALAEVRPPDQKAASRVWDRDSGLPGLLDASVAEDG